jgi:hypothetical protein
LQTRDEHREAQLRKEGIHVHVFLDLFVGNEKLSRGDICKLALQQPKLKKRPIVFAKIVEFWAKTSPFGVRCVPLLSSHLDFMNMSIKYVGS